MVLILDRQHYGKPGQNDLGAGADLDGDGVVELDEREANLTLLYINAAKQLRPRATRSTCSTLVGTATGTSRQSESPSLTPTTCAHISHAT